MSDTTFVSGTVIASAWLNDVNDAVYVDAINVKRYGATGDGVTDDTAAIQAAIDAMVALGGGRVVLPRSSYAVTNLVVDGDSISIVGEGTWGQFGTGPGGGTVYGSTTLIGTSITGPVIRIKGNGCTLEGFTVSANTARRAAVLGTNFGIQVEAEDTSGSSTIQTYMERVRVTNQPSHGIVWVNNIVSSRMQMVGVDNCYGHGIAVLGGTFSARTFLTRPGQLQIDNCRATRCGGHGLLVGGLLETTTNDVPYRVEVRNLETFYCATSAAVRLSAHNNYISGENHQFDASALDGLTDASNDDRTCLYLQGQYISLRNTRFINGNPYAAEIGVHPLVGTKSIEILHPKVVNTLQATGFFDPAFLIATNATNVAITVSGSEPAITSVASSTATDHIYHFNGQIDTTKTFNRRLLGTSGISSLEASLAIADDGAAYIAFSAACQGMLAISSSLPGSGGAALVSFRVGDASKAVAVLSSAGPTVTPLTGELTGTTGTDTQFSISASQTFARLYVENRTGTARNYNYTLMNLGDAITASEMVGV